LFHRWHDFRTRNGVVHGEVKPGWSLQIHAIVCIVADAIRVQIEDAIPFTIIKLRKCIAITVAIPFWDVRAAAGIHCTRAIANTTGVKLSYALVYVVANAIGIRIHSTNTTTHAQGIKLVAITVAITDRNLRTAAGIDCTRAIADATSVKCTNTFVHVVANVIGIGVCSTGPTTHAQSVELVAVAIAVIRREICTSAFINLTWTVANATIVKCAYTFVHVVANAIDISVPSTVTTANAQGI
tara:strand:+ start:12358 stop:13080 length:723 start_codon:yes stop_codon:yes gene_type:complete